MYISIYIYIYIFKILIRKNKDLWQLVSYFYFRNSTFESHQIIKQITFTEIFIKFSY